MTGPRDHAVRAVLLTALAVTAFAANSLLCRLALLGGAMDPVTFTALRLCSAALVLAAMLHCRQRRGSMTPVSVRRSGDPVAALWLFVYAIAFSYAYVSIEAGTGALLVFGAVQATMILSGLATGERPPGREWLGFVLAVAGVLYLLLPGAHAPGWLPALGMVTAGVAWGLYSLRGRSVTDPAAATCGNFVRTAPVAIALWAATALVLPVRASWPTVFAALASGALASGLGYIVWYHALRYLTATRAAIVQLLAPILAALGGVGFLGETITPRLVLATAAVCSGVAIVATTRRRPVAAPTAGSR